MCYICLSVVQLSTAINCSFMAQASTMLPFPRNLEHTDGSRLHTSDLTIAPNGKCGKLPIRTNFIAQWKALSLPIQRADVAPSSCGWMFFCNSSCYTPIPVTFFCSFGIVSRWLSPIVANVCDRYVLGRCKSALAELPCGPTPGQHRKVGVLYEMFGFWFIFYGFRIPVQHGRLEQLNRWKNDHICNIFLLLVYLTIANPAENVDEWLLHGLHFCEEKYVTINFYGSNAYIEQD